LGQEPKYFDISRGVMNEHSHSSVNEEERSMVLKDNGNWAKLFISHFYILSI
jgi:hypothetical protein